MKATLLNLLTYTRLIFRKWVLWAFAVLDLIAFAAQLWLPSFRVPPFAFLLILAVGIYWASYQVYLDIARRLPSFPTEPPPYEVLPHSFDINFSGIPRVEVSLYVVNHQPRELVLESVEVTELRLFASPSLDPVPHTGDTRVETRGSTRIICRRQLTHAEVQAIAKTKQTNPTTADFHVVVRALAGHRHLNQETKQLSAKGWLYGIPPGQP